MMFTCLFVLSCVVLFDSTSSCDTKHLVEFKLMGFETRETISGEDKCGESSACDLYFRARFVGYDKELWFYNKDDQNKWPHSKLKDDGSYSKLNYKYNNKQNQVLLNIQFFEIDKDLDAQQITEVIQEANAKVRHSAVDYLWDEDHKINTSYSHKYTNSSLIIEDPDMADTHDKTKIVYSFKMDVIRQDCTTTTVSTTTSSTTSLTTKSTTGYMTTTTIPHQKTIKLSPVIVGGMVLLGIVGIIIIIILLRKRRHSRKQSRSQKPTEYSTGTSTKSSAMPTMKAYNMSHFKPPRYQFSNMSMQRSRSNVAPLDKSHVGQSNFITKLSKMSRNTKAPTKHAPSSRDYASVGSSNKTKQYTNKQGVIKGQESSIFGTPARNPNLTSAQVEKDSRTRNTFVGSKGTQRVQAASGSSRLLPNRLGR